MNNKLAKFLAESNTIEGIHRPPTGEEISETKRFLVLDEVRRGDLQKLALVYQPNAFLRLAPRMDVRIGSHIPPAGGEGILWRLGEVLEKVKAGESPYLVHQEYENLHPFMDGNGRTGRALWLWQMINQHGWDFRLSFLHKFYYQALDHGR